MSTPVKPTLRYGELVEWLQTKGVAENAGRRHIHKGVIKSYGLTGETWRYFNRDQVENEVFPLLGLKKDGEP